MKGRKIVSLLLALTLIMSTLPVQVFAKEKVGVGAPILQALETQETTPAAIQIIPNKYIGDGYEVEFKVVSQWGGKFDGEIILTNTGDKVIESWALEFDFKHTIGSIWNAELISNENGYTFKNLGWNKDIKPGASVSIGFGASWDNQILAPEKYDLVASKQNVADQDYTIEFKITSDWGQGFNGEISITNNTEEVIEDWVLEFDFDRDIESFWTAEIAEHIGDHYIIKNAGYNANIKPGKTIKLGFEGTPGDVNSEPKNYALKEVGKEVDYEKDTDKDGLPDWLEEELGTDPLNPDTDGDGLPDGYEYYVLGTDPLKKDTDGNGIDDGDEDFDEDGLTNLEEYELGTDPYNADTDFDGLTDYDEVYIYGTDPLEYDTDEDGLSDSQEVELGTDPLNPDTNGNGILDGDEIYTVEKTADIGFLDENIIPTVTIDLEGDLIESLHIYALQKDDLYLPSEMPGYIGAGYEFELGGEFEEATLTFEFNPVFLEIEDFEPAIYHYDEEEQLMEYVADQEIDWENNKVTSKIEHFSKYILIDHTKYLKVWEEIIKVPSEEDLNKPLDIALVIDSSGSMGWNDPKDMRKSTARQFVDQLREDDRVSIIDFDSRAILLSPFTTDKEAANKAIDRIDSSGGTSLTAGIRMALQQFNTPKSYATNAVFSEEIIEDSEEPGENGLDINGEPLICQHNNMMKLDEPSQRDPLKYIIMLTDGVGAYDHRLTKTAVDNDITIFTVGLGDQLDENLLRKIASETYGRYLYAATADDLVDEFASLTEEVIDFAKDTDRDGLSDYYEKKLRYSNGVKIDTDPNNPDTDGDGLLDGEEIIVREANVIIKGKQYKRVYAKMKSHPKMKDTDRDGYSDYEEVKASEQKTQGYNYIGPLKRLEALKWNISDRDLAMAADMAYVDLPSRVELDNISVRKKGEIDRRFEGLAQVDELEGWKILECVYNRFTGFEAIAFKKGKNIILAFRGSEANNWQDILQDWVVADFFGISTGLNPQVTAAKKFTKSIAKQYKGCDVYLTGHSLGGYLSQMSTASLIKTFKHKQIAESVNFNGPGLGFFLSVLNDWDEQLALELNKEKINNYRVKGDIVSKVGTHAGEETTVSYGEETKKNYNFAIGPHMMGSFYEDKQFQLTGRGLK